jgi:hypothetical protein
VRCAGTSDLSIRIACGVVKEISVSGRGELLVAKCPVLRSPGNTVVAGDDPRPRFAPAIRWRAGSVREPSLWRARRGRNRLSVFAPGKGRGQCSCLSWRILAQTFTTPRNNGLWPEQGRNRDCRVRLHATHPTGGGFDVVEGTLRGLPAQMVVYLFYLFILMQALILN